MTKVQVRFGDIPQFTLFTLQKEDSFLTWKKDNGVVAVLWDVDANRVGEDGDDDFGVEILMDFDELVWIDLDQ